LIHRRNEFRGALDSVERIKDAGKIRMITRWGSGIKRSWTSNQSILRKTARIVK
jgi:thioredoxin reductase